MRERRKEVITTSLSRKKKEHKKTINRFFGTRSHLYHIVLIFGCFNTKQNLFYYELINAWIFCHIIAFGIPSCFCFFALQGNSCKSETQYNSSESLRKTAWKEDGIFSSAGFFDFSCSNILFLFQLNHLP